MWIPRNPQVLTRGVHAFRLGLALFQGLQRGIRRQPIKYVDIGARGGLPRSWNVLWKAGLVDPAFVEPEPLAAEALARLYPNTTIIRHALGETQGPKTLFVTRQPGCSSLLRPDLSAYVPPQMQSMYEIVDEIEVDVERAEDALSAESIVPDVLKIDVQGMELSILRGLGPILSEITSVELEVSFTRTYENQPLFLEIFDYMNNAGFGLTYISAFGVVGTGNAIQANALFGNRIKNDSRSIAIEDIALRAMGGGYSP